MATDIDRPDGGVNDTEPVSTTFRIAAMGLRTVFILLLIAIVVRVSMPQSEHITTVYETMGDAVRVLLGFVFCIWVAFHAFKWPKDAGAYRTWFYFSLMALPFATLCLILVW